MERKKTSLQDAIEFVIDGNVSDLLELSFDKSDDDMSMLLKISFEESKNSDTDDDILLSAIASTSTDNNKGNPELGIKQICRWHKKDTFVGQHEFRGKFIQATSNWNDSIWLFLNVHFQNVHYPRNYWLHSRTDKLV